MWILAAALAVACSIGAGRVCAQGSMSLLDVAAAMTKQPETVDGRPYPTFQPQLPAPAKELQVADVRALSKDQRILLTSLQGIVNRKQPRIFLATSDDDLFWLKVMQQQGATGTPATVSDPMTLVAMFRSEIQGAVVADPKVYVSPDIAVDLAGLDDVVIATPELASQLGLPIVDDLRGKFHDDAEALAYARTQLLPRANPYLSICIDPAILDSGAIDHIIAGRGLAFWVTGPKSQGLPGANAGAERAELERTLAAMPLCAAVHGFWWHGDGVGLQEPDGVGLASSYGKVTTVSDYTGNFSVYEGIRVPSLKQKARPAPPALDRSKVYVALTMSDGDNLCTWRGYFRKYFQDPARGTIPVGWGMAPTLLDCAPVMARWYYEQASAQDEFICDVSGVGYMYPSKWGTKLQDREGAFREFYRWTDQYMGRMDMKTIRLMDVGKDDIARAGRDLPSVKFMMPDYGYQNVWDYDGMTYSLPGGQSVFRAVTDGSGPDHLASQISHHAGGNRPAFVNAFIWNWGSKLGDLKTLQAKLGSEYVFVTPSQLDALYRQRPKDGLGHILVDNPVVNGWNWLMGH